MIAARFLDIANLITTVNDINGLKNNPTTAEIRLQLLSLQPKDTKDFAHKYNRIANYRNALQPTNPWQNTVEQGSLYTATPTLRAPGRATQRYTPYHPNPCRHHMSKGVRMPQHSYNDIRDPTYAKQKGRALENALQGLSRPRNRYHTPLQTRSSRHRRIRG